MTNHESEFEFDAKAFVLQLADAFNGMASPDELEQLNAILVQSPEARELAINFFDDESLLHEELHGCVVKSGFHTDLAIPLYELARRNDKSEEFKSHLASPRRNRSLLTSLAAIATAVAVLFAISWHFSPELPVVKSSAIELQNCSSTVLTADGNRLLPGSMIHLGDTLAMESGMAELRFETGVNLIMKGPATLQIVSPMQTVLSRGVVTASVEETAHGFRVDTPTSLVTDLGTEFGVSVAETGDTDIVVFTGEVALQKQIQVQAPAAEEPSSTGRGQLMLEGEGLRVRDHGVERLVSINSSDYPRKFLSTEQTASPVILSVSDNLSASDTIKCYQIHHRKFNEDARAFVDRRYQWNGINKEHGLPRVLRGADYVMPFCDDKINDHIEIEVEIAQAARVFVLIDNRLKIPKWLIEGFEDTGYDVAVDEDQHTARRVWQELGKGPGVSLEKSCSVWFKDVSSPGNLAFGAIEPPVSWSLMYAIAAVPLSAAESTLSEPLSNHTPKIGSGLIREDFLPVPLAKAKLDCNTLYSRLSITPSREDAGSSQNGMKFTPETLGGKFVPHRNTPMVDGVMPTMNDGDTASYDRHFKRCAWYDGQARFSLDLKRSVEIEAINCFSRHDFVRSWQFYTVWGSNADEKPAVDFDRPDHAKGWDYIGLVDSRDQYCGHIHASSLRAADGPIGTYRHLLWICEDIRYSTCFTEIDIHEAE